MGNFGGVVSHDVLNREKNWGAGLVLATFAEGGRGFSSWPPSFLFGVGGGEIRAKGCLIIRQHSVRAYAYTYDPVGRLLTVSMGK